jgi:hypothetical protein
VTVKPEDLRGEARDAYRMWRDTFGLSEAAAMNALIEDGVITLSEDEKLARRFQRLFGLSEEAAKTAAVGRDSRTASSPTTTTRPLVESNLEWHARMQREFAELDRGIAEVDAMQRELYPKLITEDIARTHAEEMRRLRGD